MSEIYTSTSRKVLQEYTKIWAETPTDPTEAYQQFRTRLGSRAFAYSTYVSSSVSRGGYIRDPRLDRHEVPPKNSLVGMEYADALHDEGLIDLERSVEGVVLGYIPSWTQSGYLEFWFHVMTRPDFNARDLAQYKYRKARHTGVDFETFNNESLSNDERRPEYLAYVDQYLECVSDIPAQPIDRAVQLIDRKMSLGGDAEAQLAHKIGAKVCAPALVEYITDPRQYPWANPSLAIHLNELSTLGAIVLEPVAEKRLVLVEERPPIQ